MLSKLFQKRVLIPFILLIMAIIPLTAMASGGYLPSGGDLSWADSEVIGEGSSSIAGQSVSIVGDVNNDGFDDLVVGAPGFSGNGYNAGAAYLMLGHSVWGQTWTLGGNYVMCGWDDVITLGSGNFCGTMIRFDGPASYSRAGFSVSGAGDVNADGFDDFLIGAPGWSEERGAAYLILGSANPSGGTLGQVGTAYIGVQSGGEAGHSVAGAGDVNDDGYDDIVIGAPYVSGGGGINAGAAYLLQGGSNGNLGGAVNGPSSLAVFDGLAANGFAGSSVAGVGNVNNDRYDDILIGVPGDGGNGGGAGAAHLILGGNSISGNLTFAIKYSGQFANDRAGSAVSAAGDVNNDGYDDFLIGSPQYGSGRGATYMVGGKAVPTSNILSLGFARVYWGENYYDFSGSSMAPAGDVNFDGYDDFFIGAPGYDIAGNNNAGAAYLIYGSYASGGAVLNAADVKYTGTQYDANAGASLAGNGDLNGDGTPDWVVGEPFNDSNGFDSGSVFVYQNGYWDWAACYYWGQCWIF